MNEEPTASPWSDLPSNTVPGTSETRSSRKDQGWVGPTILLLLLGYLVVLPFLGAITVAAEGIKPEGWVCAVAIYVVLWTALWNGAHWALWLMAFLLGLSSFACIHFGLRLKEDFLVGKGICDGVFALLSVCLPQVRRFLRSQRARKTYVAYRN